MSEVHIGLKLGQVQEASGLVVTEREQQDFTVRTLHRFPAGTSYTQIAEDLAAIVGKLQALHPRLYLDITGLGLPIQDIITRRLNSLDCPLMAATFTYGDRCQWDTGAVTVGKLYLLSQMKALLQEGWLHLPDTEETRLLVRDIKNYQPTIDPQANDRYGAFSVGRRDELVTALGLSVLDTRYSAQMALEDMQGWAKRVKEQVTVAQGQEAQSPSHRQPWQRFHG